MNKIFKINFNDIINLLKKENKNKFEINYIVNYYNDHPFFSNYLKKNQINILEYLLNFIEFKLIKKNEVLICEENTFQDFYIIFEGSLKLFVEKNDNELTNSIIINKLKNKLKNNKTTEYKNSFYEKNKNNYKIFKNNNNKVLLLKKTDHNFNNKIIKKSNLFEENKNNKYIVFLKDSYLGKISIKNYNQILNKIEEENYNKYYNYFFNKLSSFLNIIEIRYIINFFDIIKIKGKKNLINQNDKLEFLYLIKDGEIEINQNIKLNKVNYNKEYKSNENYKKMLDFKIKSNLIRRI